MTFLLNRKLLLFILLAMPSLMVVGGTRTPNLAKLLELRQHVHHCALQETKQKLTVGKCKNFNHKESQNLEACASIVFIPIQTFYSISSPVEVSFPFSPALAVSPRAPPQASALASC